MKSSLLFRPLCMVMLLFPGGTFAQTNGNIWKRTITRQVELDIRKNADVKLPANKTREITLLETLINEVRAGRLTAYSNLDHSITIKPDDNNYTINPKKDTETVTDLVTNEELTRVRVKELTFDIHTYRTLEQWTYDPATGTTKIQITDIAPVRDVYGDDGILRGIQAMFWLKYKDAVGVIRKYEAAHPKNAITQLIRNDNFTGGADIAPDKTFALRKVDVEKKETVVYHLRDAGDAQSIPNLLNEELKNGQQAAYSGTDLDFKKKLTLSEAATLAVRTDTVTVIDPVSTKEVEKVRTGDFFDSNCALVEKWTFDVAAGKTEIQQVALASYENYSYGSNPKTEAKPLLMVKYDDIKSLLEKYNQYHPTATLAGKIWDSYFSADVKPEVIK